MRDSDRQTRSHLMAKFAEQGIHPRGDLGQNFLIDLNLIDYVVEKARLTVDDVALEIGAGTGGLTAFLAQDAGHVVSVEIDSRVHAFASQAIAGYPNVTLMLGDALKNKNNLSPVVLEELALRLAESPKRGLKLVANLPYSVATPVISNIVASELPWRAMIVTIQWELAERMRARPGTSDYGALSVWLQSQCQITVLKKLKPTVFWPRPQVDSAIVRLLPDPERREQIGNRAFFQDFIRRLFTQRRKFVRGVLAGMYRQQLDKPEIDRILEPLALPEGVRAEQLDVDTLVRLGRAFSQAFADKTPSAGGQT